MMAVFLRCLVGNSKSEKLAELTADYRAGNENNLTFEKDPEKFVVLPGGPYVYWKSDAVLSAFKKFPEFEGENRTARQGIATADDFRFLRSWWETGHRKDFWMSFAKGGGYHPFFHDLDLVVNWKGNGREISNFFGPNGKLRSRLQNTIFSGRPGITWSLRPSKSGSFRALPKETVFSIMGSAAFQKGDATDELLSTLAILNSKPFNELMSLLSSRGGEGSAQTKTYDVGCLSKSPIPNTTEEISKELNILAIRAWKAKRTTVSVDETSHVFLLPEALRDRLDNYDPFFLQRELSEIQTKIDDITLGLYGFSDTEEFAALGTSGVVDKDDCFEEASDIEDHDDAETVDKRDGLLSWAVGVAFGRFDWRLATGEHEAPPEPEPFDPLPSKSPGMLPDDAAPFYAHSGILVDDQGHPNDLVRLIETALTRVEAEIPGDVRRWLQHDFFTLHLKQYSKSRRKAPIYWPISTNSGNYTLWFYYPSLTAQTLYTAVNDFIEGPSGKLAQVGRDISTLRAKGSARSVEDEKQFEGLQALELELIELRDALLQIAATFRPSHDDGVQITAAPLWQLFRHKPWQKILKDTWTKLEKGDYDWAHLAMAYWPDRVREKCKKDKSLAIAHDLELLFVEPEPKANIARGRKKDAE